MVIHPRARARQFQLRAAVCAHLVPRVTRRRIRPDRPRRVRFGDLGRRSRRRIGGSAFDGGLDPSRLDSRRALRRVRDLDGPRCHLVGLGGEDDLRVRSGGDLRWRPRARSDVRNTQGPQKDRRRCGNRTCHGRGPRARLAPAPRLVSEERGGRHPARDDQAAELPGRLLERPGRAGRDRHPADALARRRRFTRARARVRGGRDPGDGADRLHDVVARRSDRDRRRPNRLRRPSSPAPRAAADAPQHGHWRPRSDRPREPARGSVERPVDLGRGNPGGPDDPRRPRCRRCRWPVRGSDPRGRRTRRRPPAPDQPADLACASRPPPRS